MLASVEKLRKLGILTDQESGQFSRMLFVAESRIDSEVIEATLVQPPVPQERAAASLPQKTAIEISPSAEPHALDREYSIQPPSIAAQSRATAKRALGDVLKQFLSARNIHWGELLSALLIVGSAVGLILSLRTELSRIIPMFPAVIFSLVVLAIHLAGFYTLTRWKLPSTSRGLLFLGAIMIPISALASSLLLKGDASSGLQSQTFILPAILGGLGLGTLAFLAGRHLFPSAPLAWSFPPVLSGLAILVTRHHPDVSHSEMAFLSLAAGALSPLLATALTLSLSSWLESRTNRRILPYEPLRLLGSSGFAATVAVVYLLFQAEVSMERPLKIAIPAWLLGTLCCWIGGYFSKRARANDTLDGRPTTDMPPAIRLVGTSISILAGLAFLAGLLASHSDFSRFQQVVMLGLASCVVFAVVWREISLAAISMVLTQLAVWLQALRFAELASAEGISRRWLLSVLPTTTTAWTASFLAVGFGFFSWLVFKQSKVAVDRSREGESKSLSLRNMQTRGELKLDGLASLAAIPQAVIAVGLAVYFGLFANTDAQITTSICILTTAILFSCVVAHRAAYQPAFLIFALGLLLLTYVLVRPGTYVERTFHFGDWGWWSRAILHTSSYAVICFGMFHLLSFIPIRSHKRATWDTRLSISWLGVSVALISVFWIILRTDPLFWSWSAGWLASLSALLITHYFARSRFEGQKELADGSTSPTLGLVTQLSALFATLFAFAELNRVAIPAIDAQLAFSSSATLILIASTVMTCLSQRIARWPFLDGWRTKLGDGLYLLFLAYQQVSIWTASVSWGRTVQLGLYGDAIAWSCLHCAVLVSLIAMTIVRSASLYVWIAGFYCCITTAQLLITWFPSGSDVTALFYLTASSPLLLSIGLAIASHLQRRRWSNVETTNVGATQDDSIKAFDNFLLIGTTLIWCLITSIAWFSRFANETFELWGLATPIGFVWVGIMAIFLAIHFPLARDTLPTSFGNLAAFCVCLHLPIAVERLFSFRFATTTVPSLLFLAMGVYVSLSGMLPFLIRRWRTIPALASREQFDGQPLSAHWTVHEFFAAIIAMVTFVGCLGLSLLQRDNASLQLAASANVCNALGLWLFRLTSSKSAGREQSYPWLHVASFALAVVLIAWSFIDPANWETVWTSRSLRITVLGLLASLGASVYYALTPDFDQTDRPLGSLVDRILGLRPRWWEHGEGRERLSQIWLLSSIIVVISLIVDICLMRLLLKSDLRVQHVGAAGPIDREVFVCVCLSGLWLPCLVVQALRDRWNIARLQPRSKCSYIFLSEFVFCSAAILLYFIRPNWFDLPFRAYWPIILLIVAVVFQGVGQLLARSGVEAVSTPLRLTSLAFPVAAAVGLLFIATDARSDLVLLLGGIFYFAMGGAGESRRFAILGGVFVNAALLVFWSHEGMFRFSKHPQLWLVPPAISVLIATHFEKRSLPPAVLNWVRYLAVATIFLSSSSEILVQGLGQQLWPPMILLFLSVLAVLLGIGFRVRSYLFSGVLFLLVAMFAMVTHAQQSLQHTWPWWAFGISLGVGILVLFGWFEKRREELHQIANKLKEWEA